MLAPSVAQETVINCDAENVPPFGDIAGVATLDVGVTGVLNVAGLRVSEALS